MAIGTTAAIVGGTLGSAVIGASSANKAAKAQSAAAANDLALKRDIYDDTSRKFEPYLSSGNNALSAYNYELGLGAAPTVGGTPMQITEIPGVSGNPSGSWATGAAEQGAPTFKVGDQIFASREEAEAYASANLQGGTAYGGFTKTPGYDFRMQEGVDAITAAGSVAGGVNSGSTLKALTRYGQDYGTGEYNNYLNRLSGLMSSGQNAAGQQAAAGQNYSAGAGNAYANMGNASAAGAIGMGNALQGGIQNGLSAYMYQNQLTQPTNYAPQTSMVPKANPYY